ncbi:MAG: hypothetical protein ASUL_08604 [Candidatus Aramenus sulfurataquae]|uniref:PIN domain-containing protein n=1 Tax=Candidatus Aramenus sulfurataquae TaxID=1326980 RepID=W7KHA2_9CREN|nr:MAG: hypothetical protein ASUL_08604 [Candidatus Aramenus sulfurataquae]
MARTLAVLGSDKLVTTTNAILTEVFTGFIPDEIVVLSETAHKKDISPLSDLVSMFSDVKVKLREEVVGKGVEKWREKVSSLNVDVADVTPGRKYMAIVVYTYSKANEVRYVFLEKEREGYRVFGYAPFNEIKVFDLRTGRDVPFSPPQVKRCGSEASYLSNDGLRALINVYSLLGKVGLIIDGEEVSLEELTDFIKKNGYGGEMGVNAYELCATRSGLLVFKEEEEVRKKVDSNTFFVADTNVYISLGNRIGLITYSKEHGRRLIPTRSVFNEIENKLGTTQKGDEKLKVFQLASLSFRSLHAPPISSNVRGSGDVPFIDETASLKAFLPHVVMVTRDQGLTRAAQGKGIEVVHLKELGRGSLEGIGEFINCLSLMGKKVKLSLNGEEKAIIESQVMASDRVKVKDKLKYACVIERAEEFIRS